MTAATFASNILEQAKLTNDQDCNHVTAACDPLLDWDFRTIAGQEVYQVSLFFNIFILQKAGVLISYKKIKGKNYFFSCQLTQIRTL
jgi:hypothetical protein